MSSFFQNRNHYRASTLLPANSTLKVVFFNVSALCLVVNLVSHCFLISREPILGDQPLAESYDEFCAEEATHAKCNEIISALEHYKQQKTIAVGLIAMFVCLIGVLNYRLLQPAVAADASKSMACTCKQPEEGQVSVLTV
jgi:hypothetical protein